MNRIHRAWHRALHRAHLWQPATPHVRLWDKHMNYIGTLGPPQPAHYTWPWRKAPNTQHQLLGNAYVDLTVDFDEAGHNKLTAARQHIATIATPQPNTPYCTCHKPTLIAANDLNCQLCGGLRPPNVC